MFFYISKLNFLNVLIIFVKGDANEVIADVAPPSLIGTLNPANAEKLNLKSALEAFFANNADGAVLEIGDKENFAVWKDFGGYMYLFDSKECDFYGNRISAPEGGAKKKGTEKAKGVRIFFRILNSNITQLFVSGKCIVARFDTLDALVGHIEAKIDPSRKNDIFVLRSVTVGKDVPGVRKWNNFLPHEAGKSWILKGTSPDEEVDTGDKSPNLKMALSALSAVAARDKSPSRWKSEDVDKIVREGGDYLKWSTSRKMEKPEDEEEQRLDVSELRKELFFGGRKVS